MRLSNMYSTMIATLLGAVLPVSLSASVQYGDDEAVSQVELKQKTLKDIPIAMQICLDAARLPGQLDWSASNGANSVPADREKVEAVVGSGRDVRIARIVGGYVPSSPYSSKKVFARQGIVWQFRDTTACHGIVESFSPNPFSPFSDDEPLGGLELFDLHFDFIDVYVKDETQYNIFRAGQKGPQIVVMISRATSTEWSKNSQAKAKFQFYVYNDGPQ